MLKVVSRLLLPAGSHFTAGQAMKGCVHHGPIYRQLYTSSRWLARFGKKAAPDPPALEAGRVTWGKIGHATAFTLVGSGSALVGCVIWEYENVRHQMRHSLDRGLNWARKFTEPNGKRAEWRVHLNQWWAAQSEGQRLFWPLCLVNVLVFAAWKVPVLMPGMLRWFASNPAARAYRLPMLLSAFSHYSFLHLAVNMFVLHSFSTGAVQLIGPEQFLGLYLSGALVSSLGSYLYKMAVFSPAVSMGASGAIMAILGFVCTERPDSRLAIIFLPMFTFTAGTAIKAVIMFDSLGAALRWGIFDHAAHLGGALLGVYWSLHGREAIWERREPIIRWYHNLREAGKPRS